MKIKKYFKLSILNAESIFSPVESFEDVRGGTFENKDDLMRYVEKNLGILRSHIDKTFKITHLNPYGNAIPAELIKTSKHISEETEAEVIDVASDEFDIESMENVASSFTFEYGDVKIVKPFSLFELPLYVASQVFEAEYDGEPETGSLKKAENINAIVWRYSGIAHDSSAESFSELLRVDPSNLGFEISINGDLKIAAEDDLGAP